MKFSTPVGFTAVIACALASCYPVDEHPRGRSSRNRNSQNAQNAVLTPEQQAEKARAAQIKKEEQARLDAIKAQEQANNLTPPNPDSNVNPNPNPTPEPKRPVRKEYVTASKVPGREGFVFSPYNNKPIDVRGIPSGTLVQDPTYQKSEEKFFRVP